MAALTPGSTGEETPHLAVPHPPRTVAERQALRAQILAFEAALAQVPDAVHGDSDQLPLTHSFGDGCYVREIFIPTGWIYVGKIHKHAHPRFLLKGELLIATEFGGTEHHVAPCYMLTPAGTKRAGIALQDTIIVTVHVTQETDLDKIEADIIAPDYTAFEAYRAALLSPAMPVALGPAEEHTP